MLTVETNLEGTRTVVWDVSTATLASADMVGKVFAHCVVAVPEKAAAELRECLIEAQMTILVVVDLERSLA